MEIERAIVFGVIVCAAFSLGFISGSAYVKRKMRRREKLEYISQPDYPTISRTKEDEDTKTGELKIERATKGHPDDA